VGCTISCPLTNLVVVFYFVVLFWVCMFWSRTLGQHIALTEHASTLIPPSISSAATVSWCCFKVHLSCSGATRIHRSSFCVAFPAVISSLVCHTPIRSFCSFLGIKQPTRLHFGQWTCMTISSSLGVIDLATAIRCNCQIVSLSMPCVRGCTRILCSQCCDVSSILASHRSAGFALDDAVACML
jgi:hypothetical protein